MFPTIIVCTGHCGEPDFSHCVEALKAQTGVMVRHYVFNDMNELDMHNAIYKTFNEADPTWLRCKLDADMVLEPDALSRVARVFTRNPMVDVVDAEVHDYMTDGPLHGILTWSPRVRFKEQTNNLCCDHNVTIPTFLGTQNMGIIAKHMHFSDERTGFRYGLHRGLKGQVGTLNKVRDAYNQRQDKPRLAAIKGFELAETELFKEVRLGTKVPFGFNYNDPEFLELFVKTVELE